MPINTISSSFYSLRYYQIITFYDKYSIFIDFALFLMIFTGLIKTVFHNQWQEGSGKKALITGLSAALSLALILTKEQIGFSIQSLGPIAAIIFLLLLGFGLFKMFRSFQINTGTSICLTAVLGYFSLISVTPNIFEYGLFKPYLDLIDLIIAIGVIYCIYRLLTYCFGNIYNSDKQFQQLQEISESGGNNNKQINIDENSAFNTERKFIKQKIKPEIKKSSKDIKYILKSLFKIRKLLKNGKYSNEELNNLLKEILIYKNDFENHSNIIIKNIKMLGAFDFELYKIYNTQIKKLSKQEQEVLQNKISAEYEKYCDESKMLEFENKVLTFKNQFLFELNDSITDLKKGNAASALTKLENAIRYMLEMYSIEKNVYQLYKQIYKINMSEMN